jgi:hypothetical protein
MFAWTISSSFWLPPTAFKAVGRESNGLIMRQIQPSAGKKPQRRIQSVDPRVGMDKANAKRGLNEIKPTKCSASEFVGDAFVQDIKMEWVVVE